MSEEKLDEPSLAEVVEALGILTAESVTICGQVVEIDLGGTVLRVAAKSITLRRQVGLIACAGKPRVKVVVNGKTMPEPIEWMLDLGVREGIKSLPADQQAPLFEALSAWHHGRGVNAAAAASRARGEK